jgi:hypothetical protein
MKIEGPNKSGASAPTRKGDGVSVADAAAFRGLMAVDDTPDTAATAPTRTIAALDTLLAVQATEDPQEKAAKSRMRARAGSILAALEELRGGLLVGRLTVGHLIDLADVVASHRDRIIDPHLTALIDEIDLRAQVELAKLRVALDQVV